MLKSFLLFAAVVLLVFASAPAPAGAPQEASQSAGKKTSDAALAKAKKVYDLDCALCHGAVGNGKTDLAKDMSLTMEDWTDPKSLANQSDQALIEVIRKGKGKMPPEDGARATNDEVKNLVIYIRKFAGQTAPAAPATTDQPAAAPEAAPAAAPAQSPSL